MRSACTPWSLASSSRAVPVARLKALADGAVPAGGPPKSTPWTWSRGPQLLSRAVTSLIRSPNLRAVARSPGTISSVDASDGVAVTSPA